MQATGGGRFGPPFLHDLDLEPPPKAELVINMITIVK